MKQERTSEEIMISKLNLITKRNGADRLIAFLKESDFFTAPASRRYHCNYKGGLVQHSLNVLQALQGVLWGVWSANQFTDTPTAMPFGTIVPDNSFISLETMIIVAVCHDLCKVNHYVPVEENATSAQQNFARDLFGKAKRKLNPAFATNKDFCSSLIQWAKNNFEGAEPIPQQQWEIKDDFPLGHGTKSVLIASRLIELTEEEMLAIKWHSGPFESSEMEKHSYYEAMKKTPLVTMLFAADYLSTFVLEA
jgi:hypothetical protein